MNELIEFLRQYPEGATIGDICVFLQMPRRSANKILRSDRRIHWVGMASSSRWCCDDTLETAKQYQANRRMGRRERDRLAKRKQRARVVDMTEWPRPVNSVWQLAAA